MKTKIEQHLDHEYEQAKRHALNDPKVIKGLNEGKDLHIKLTVNPNGLEDARR